MARLQQLLLPLLAAAAHAQSQEQPQRLRAPMFASSGLTAATGSALAVPKQETLECESTILL